MLGRAHVHANAISKIILIIGKAHMSLGFLLLVSCSSFSDVHTSMLASHDSVPGLNVSLLSQIPSRI